MREHRYMQLFFTFLRIGAFTFGGGYAMIPLIRREVVESKKWIGEDDMLDIIAIAESTPGPLAINSATFVGKQVAGTRGAILATLGVSMPSFLIILAISYVLEQVETVQVVQNAFVGIRVGVLALILSALTSMVKHLKRSIWNYSLMLVGFVLVAVFHVSAIITLLIGAILGIGKTILIARREI